MISDKHITVIHVGMKYVLILPIIEMYKSQNKATNIQVKMQPINGYISTPCEGNMQKKRKKIQYISNQIDTENALSSMEKIELV